MTDFTLYAAISNVGYVLFAILLLFGAMRVFNWLTGGGLDADIETMRSQPLAIALYRAARLLIIGLIIASVLGCAAAEARPVERFSSRYDGQIERAVDRWWPDFPDWLYWKSQLFQESLLDPDAVSPVGAEGIAQFMPATWSQVTRQLGWSGVSPRDARYAIEAGAFYMARLRRTWSSPRPELDRHFLAAASYNAGLGHLLKAQQLCGGALLYDGIIACLPCVTGRHSAETITYVERIQRWRREMAGM